MREWKQYLDKPIQCDCGRTHSCDIEDIIIKEDAGRDLAELILSKNYKHPFLVSDVNTEAAGGGKLKAALDEKGIRYEQMIFPDSALIADERAMGCVLTAMPVECDLIIAVGSGTINDICKFVSFKIKRDFMIYATAPSMDGYASDVAALIVKELKVTLEAHNPKAIIGDLDILAAAPMDMIAAGVGDILGKYVCLADWKLSHIINGEYHCEFAEGLVRESIQAVVRYADRLQSGDKEAIASVMEGLILSGIVMRYIGNSRPASGSEHHLSHYWEMMFMLQGKKPILHGTKVGIGTIIGLALYKRLPGLLENTQLMAAEKFDEAGWEAAIRERFAQSADEVVELEKRVRKNSRDSVAIRLKAMGEHLPEILELVDSLPSSQSISDLLASIGAPVLPRQIGVDKATVRDSIIYAKELRNRYGLLQMLFDSHQALDAAREMSEDLEKETV